MYFFSSVSVYLFPQKDHIAITLVKQNCLLIKIIWITKKYPAQMLKVAGDLRRPPAKFENPAHPQKSSFVLSWSASMTRTMKAQDTKRAF